MRGQLAFELPNLPLKLCHARRDRFAVRVLGLGGDWAVKQRVPLLPHLAHIDGGLSKQRESKKNQARRPGRGSHSVTQVESPAV